MGKHPKRGKEVSEINEARKRKNLFSRLLRIGYWGKNSTKTGENRKFKLYHVSITFLSENATFYKLSTTFGSRRVFTPYRKNR